MRLLITGGLGYLGGELISQLRDVPEIESIVVFDKAIYGMLHVSTLLSPKVKLVIGDLRDKLLLQKVVSEVDAVIHLASLVGAPLVDRKPVEAHDTNIEGTRALVSCIGREQRLFFASTGSCYGRVEGICTEESPISPLSSYGRHKAEGEKIVSEVDAICFRFATVYGLSYRTRDDLYINNMVQRAIIDKSAVLYEGGARRTFIHVADAAAAVKHLLLKNVLEHRVYNIGDPSLSYSKREICANIGKHIKFNIIENDYYSDPDQRDYEVSYQRLLSTGFSSSRRLETEVAGIINYYSAKFNSGYLNG